ncbi:aggregation-promoting factor C-terminal-like domain-containing protein [Nocardioides pacificus]
MTKPEKYVPKHRQAPARPPIGQTPKLVLRNSLLLSTVAVAATGVSIAGGVLDGSSATEETTVAAAALPDVPVDELSEAELADREVATRSDRRDSADPVKEAALTQESGRAITGAETLADDDPRDIGRALLGEYGFGPDQFQCLDSLYVSESNWRVDADNPTSSAYGIPQALPGEKMASAGADWATNPVTQIRWGLGYIADVYGTPCSAWSFKQANNWY